MVMVNRSPTLVKQRPRTLRDSVPTVVNLPGARPFTIRRGAKEDEAPSREFPEGR